MTTTTHCLSPEDSARHIDAWLRAKKRSRTWLAEELRGMGLEHMSASTIYRMLDTTQAKPWAVQLLWFYLERSGVVGISLEEEFELPVLAQQGVCALAKEYGEGATRLADRLERVGLHISVMTVWRWISCPLQPRSYWAVQLLWFYLRATEKAN